MLEITDNQLAKEYLKGRADALQILIERHIDSAYALALSYVKTQSAAEDVVQEAFIKVWKKLKQYDQAKSFRAWLMTIVKNTALDYLKKKQPVDFSQFENSDGENYFLETLSSDLPNPEELAVGNELAAELADARQSLTPKYRQIIDLKVDQDLTFREISLLLKEPLNTVKSRYRRALESLRDFLISPENG